MPVIYGLHLHQEKVRAFFSPHFTYITFGKSNHRSHRLRVYLYSASQYRQPGSNFYQV